MDFQITEYHMESDKAVRPMTLVLLADLHSAEHGDGNCDLIRAVREARPDAVLCAGDMLVGRRDAKVRETVRLMAELREIAPVYFSNGNHCTQLRLYFRKRYRELIRGLREAGVTVLNNASCRAGIAGTPARIYGLELERERYRKLRIPHMPEGEMEELLGTCEADTFSVLLAHNPQFAPHYFRWGADLTVSGHFHGGIMRIFGNRVLISPYGIPLPRFGYGKYCRRGKYLIVTSGLGEHTIPVRIHNPMELVVIRVSRGGEYGDRGRTQGI